MARKHETKPFIILVVLFRSINRHNELTGQVSLHLPRFHVCF